MDIRKWEAPHSRPGKKKPKFILGQSDVENVYYDVAWRNIYILLIRQTHIKPMLNNLFIIWCEVMLLGAVAAANCNQMKKYSHKVN